MNFNITLLGHPLYTLLEDSYRETDYVKERSIKASRASKGRSERRLDLVRIPIKDLDDSALITGLQDAIEEMDIVIAVLEEQFVTYGFGSNSGSSIDMYRTGLANMRKKAKLGIHNYSPLIAKINEIHSLLNPNFSKKLYEYLLSPTDEGYRGLINNAIVHSHETSFKEDVLRLISEAEALYMIKGIEKANSSEVAL